MANGYKSGLSLDRIDNDKGYCPENCRWASAKTQANNRRTNVFYEYNGNVHTLSEWADIVGIKRVTLENRIRLGWNIEAVLTTPVRRKGG